MSSPTDSKGWRFVMGVTGSMLGLIGVFGFNSLQIWQDWVSCWQSSFMEGQKYLDLAAAMFC